MHRSGRPTRLGVDACRADLQFRYALERADRIHSLDDVRALCSSWSDEMFFTAVDRNVAAGRYLEDAAGRLIVTDPAGELIAHERESASFRVALGWLNVGANVLADEQEREAA